MLREHILNHLEKQGIGQRKLAEVADVSESTISRFLNDRDELNFEAVFRIIKFLFPEKEKEYVAQYALTQRSMNARLCMEYGMVHRLWHITENIIHTLYDSTNPLDKEWAKIYELELLRLNRRINHEQLLLELKKYFPRALEVQIMHSFITACIYYDLNRHHLLYELLENMEQQIEQVKSSFLKHCFNIRLGLLLTNYFLKKNDIDRVRKYSLKVIKQDVADHVKANAYFSLGQSFQFESYDQAYEYMKIAYESFLISEEQERVQECELSISFLKSYWRIDHEFPRSLNSTQQTLEYIYHLIQRGEEEQAEELIYKVDPAFINDRDKGFYYYYLGLIQQKEPPFLHAVKWFKQTGNLFYLLLPIQELRKLQVDDFLLDILTM